MEKNVIRALAGAIKRLEIPDEGGFYVDANLKNVFKVTVTSSERVELRGTVELGLEQIDRMFINK